MPQLITISQGQDFERVITPPAGKRIQSVTIDGVAQVISDPYRFVIDIDGVSQDYTIDVCYQDIDTTPPETLKYTPCAFAADFMGDGATTEFLIQHFKNTRKLVAEVYKLPDYDTIGVGIKRTTADAIHVQFTSPPDVGEEYHVAITWLAQTTADCGATAAAQTFTGDDVTTEFVIVHNLGTKRIIAEVYDLATEQKVGVSIIRDTDNQIRVVFTAPPTSSEYYEIVIK